MRRRFLDHATLMLCAALAGGCASGDKSQMDSVFIPSEAWADAQRDRALASIPDRDVALAQSLFDDGWNPYFSFPAFEVYGDEVGVFNWRDRAWERTSLESYLADSAVWEPMFSLSEILEDGAPFMPRPWANLVCQDGFSSRCMIAVTQSGFDEVRWLEVDMGTGAIPEDGFDLPVARAVVDWLDRDTLLVAIGTDETDTGPTGYPLTVRRLRRGESLADASIIYRAPETAGEVSFRSRRSAQSDYRVIIATEGVRTTDVQFVDPDGRVIPLDVPVDVATLGLLGDYALFNLLEGWTDGDRIMPAGSVLAIDLKNDQAVEWVLDASEGKWVESFYGTMFTQDSAYLAILEDGVQSLYRAQRGTEGWQLDRVLGDGETVARLVSGDPAGTTLFATLESPVSEPTLYRIEGSEIVGDTRNSPSLFASDGYRVDRLTADGADGVSVPYWRISKAVSVAGEAMPTILYGYGASNFPTLPRYNAEIGRLWLDQGGAYVIAQIRGGGEYGPDWYNSGYGDNRDVPLQDFLAIAEDLIARGLATPDSLGIDGTSDGGRLVAGAALLRPDLFAAAVSRDGAVYIEAGSNEGSPILGQDLDLLETRAGRRLADRYWPERLIDAKRGCAPMLLTTWRGDQRVPATQSRALAAEMLDANCDVLLIERDGGNHATIDADLLASVYSYFSDRLGLSSPPSSEGRADDTE